MTAPLTPEQEREAVATAILIQAGWMRHQADEHPDDRRWATGAEGVERLAAYVRGLPDGDERLRALSNRTRLPGLGGIPFLQFTPEAYRAMVQLVDGEHDAERCDALLSEVARIVVADELTWARQRGMIE
jgi:hypothetical protein